MNELGIHQKYFIALETRPLSAVAGSYTYFADGDVLVAKITPCFENGKLGIAQGLENGIGFGSSEFMVLRPKPELLSEFLYYFLDQEPFREVGAKAMTGAVGHRRIPPEFVEALQIPLPPLDEQRRIVAVLDKAFAGIATATANAQKNLINARALFESYLQSTFNKSGEGWLERRLGEICGLQNGFAFQSNTFQESGVPVLRISNIQNETIEARRLVYIDPGDYRENLERFKVKKGALLIAMSGATTGKVGILDEDEIYYLNQRVGKFEPAALLDKHYLFYYLITKVEENLSISAGSAQPNLSTAQIKEFLIPLPPIEQQAKIVEIFGEIREHCEKLKSITERKLVALSELKQSLLQKAFAGELT